MYKQRGEADAGDIHRSNEDEPFQDQNCCCILKLLPRFSKLRADKGSDVAFLSITLHSVSALWHLDDLGSIMLA